MSKAQKIQGYILTDSRSGETMSAKELKKAGDKIQVVMPPYSIVAVKF